MAAILEAGACKLTLFGAPLATEVAKLKRTGDKAVFYIVGGTRQDDSIARSQACGTKLTRTCGWQLSCAIRIGDVGAVGLRWRC